MKKDWTGERMETDIYGQVAVEHLHRYALAMEWSAGKLVLDVACGEGYGSALLARNAKEVVGIDIDPATIEKAKQTYKLPNLNFQRGDVTSLPLESESFDMVVSFETLEHTARHEEMMSEIKRVLRKDGLLVISTPDKKWYSDNRNYSNPFHEKELYREEFETLLKKYFTNVEICGQLFLSGSLIIPEKNVQEKKWYSGSFDDIKRSDVFPEYYLIALASNGILPVLPASLFSGEHIMEKALEMQEAAFRNSITYRTGHLILWPFKWIKKRLRHS